MVHERHHPVGDRVARRLVPRHDQEREEVVELHRRQAQPVDLRVDQLGNQVVLRRAAAALCHGMAVLAELGGRRTAEGKEAVLAGVVPAHHQVGVFRVRVPDHPVAPLDELVGVLVGDAQDAGEHADRELPRDLLDEVELGLGERLVQDRSRQIPAVAFVLLDGPRREQRAHDLAEPRVAGRVRLHHGSAGGQLVGGHLLQDHALSIAA